MSLDNILRGIIIAIETIFSVEDDIKKLGGSIC
ncbi:Peptidase [Fusobacterium vincentii ATCC 49256]|nr:Peptidase [Fusobacterium vincentii ATCC 49256]